MATFDNLFDDLIKLEGGLTLSTLPTEHTATYAGIYRYAHPKWVGWRDIDRGILPSKEVVKKFYMEEFWFKIRGYEIINESIAFSFLEFSVNAGVTTATKMVQEIIGVSIDGNVGNETISALNKIDSDTFYYKFAFYKLRKYRNIVMANPSKRQMLLGWVNRLLSGEFHA